MSHTQVTCASNLQSSTFKFHSSAPLQTTSLLLASHTASSCDWKISLFCSALFCLLRSIWAVSFPWCRNLACRGFCRRLQVFLHRSLALSAVSADSLTSQFMQLAAPISFVSPQGDWPVYCASLISELQNFSALLGSSVILWLLDRCRCAKLPFPRFFKRQLALFPLEFSWS
jgi:hypothetical protein